MELCGFWGEMWRKCPFPILRSQAGHSLLWQTITSKSSLKRDQVCIVEIVATQLKCRRRTSAYSYIHNASPSYISKNWYSYVLWQYLGHCSIVVIHKSSSQCHHITSVWCTLQNVRHQNDEVEYRTLLTLVEITYICTLYGSDKMVYYFLTANYISRINSSSQYHIDIQW